MANRDVIPMIPAGGQGVDSYNNPLPSVVAVGGIPAGTTFENKPLTALFDDMFYPELFPELVPPDNSFSLMQSGLHEISEIIAVLEFTAGFNRGAISPAYGTTGNRSGLPNAYNYTGAGLPGVVNSNLLGDVQGVTNYVVLAGVQTWGCTVSYDAGEQPKSSKNNDYDSPLPLGTTGNKSVGITGVYPWFATSVSMLVYTKQPLALMNSAYVQVTVAAESNGDKQTVDFPLAWAVITGIEFYNTLTSTWEYINGSKANSLATFTVSGVSHVIQGNSVDYNRFTHNGSTTGARMLRFHTD